MNLLKRSFGAIFLVATFYHVTANLSLVAQTPSPSGRSATQVLLWPKGAPGAVGTEAPDLPSLAIFNSFADTANSKRAAVLILPGGAYVSLAADHEGRQVAEWLNKRGVASFVLTYRLSPRYHYPSQLQDASRAMRLIRSHAAEYGVDPARIGVWGFSAGGHLASLLGTSFDAGDMSQSDPIERVSNRPDFMVLSYPVIEQYGHAALFSYQSLLGPSADPELVNKMRTDLHVTTSTPPTFLFHTDSDDAVLPTNSIAFYTGLKKAGVDAELHIYAKGPHGVGLGQSDPVLSTWPQRLEDWMRSRGYFASAYDQGAADAASLSR